jgi:hypothetical protein
MASASAPTNSDSDSHGILPSEFMRDMRPEIYSDSSWRTDYELDASVFDHHLETLTRRNQTHDFETFCRKLCERAICPNLRAQTGPDGGGDSKADGESFAVADELTDIFFEGEANSGRERWGFAFSAKAQWQRKIREDVDGLIKTGRNYDRIICVASQYIKSKARAALEDELSKATGVPVTIHDRTWIIEQVIDHGRKDLAYNYLSVGKEITDDSRLGPTDYSRLQQLDEIEQDLARAASGSGVGRDHVLDALVAAKLSRGMEKPRIETDGRFDRAIRLADKHGTLHQRIEARYERIWTAVWWHDDFGFLNDEYDTIEALAADASHARTLGFLVNLGQLLFTAVLHGHMNSEAIQLDKRVGHIAELLAPMAADGERPNNQLEADAALLHLDMNWAATARDAEALTRVWNGYSAIIDRAQGLGEFDAKRIVNLIEVAEAVAGDDPAYSALIDKLADFVAERDGGTQGALLLLRRAKKLGLDKHFEMVRLLSKAVLKLTKKEHSHDLEDALSHLTIAYRSAGLRWAARATCIFALSTMLIDAEEGERLPLRFGTLLKFWIGLSLDLRHYPDFVVAIPLLKGVVASLPYSDDDKAAFARQIQDFEVIAASQILNLSDWDIARLSDWPDILDQNQIFLTRTALLYALGYEEILRADGSIPETETPDNVSRTFSEMMSQPIGTDGANIGVVLNDATTPQRFVTHILGMAVEIHAQPSDNTILVSEMLLSSLEAFLATAIEHRIMPHTEKFTIEVIEADTAEQPAFSIDRNQMLGTLLWPASLPPTRFSEQETIRDLWPMVAAQLLDATCIIPDAEKVLTALTREERAMDRMTIATTSPNSYHRIFTRYLTRAADLAETELQSYAPRARPEIERIDIADIVAEQSGKSRAEILAREPGGESHRDYGIRSVIDLHLWDVASWRGAGFLGNEPGFPPFYALLFQDEAAATKIFERWRERYGAYDEADYIRLSIIRRIPGLDPHHYSIQISANADRAEMESGRIVGFTARSLVTEAKSDHNLETFLAMYRQFGAYYFIPAIWIDGMDEPLFLTHLPVLKRALNVLEATSLTEQDIELIAVKQAQQR